MSQKQETEPNKIIFVKEMISNPLYSNGRKIEVWQDLGDNMGYVELEVNDPMVGVLSDFSHRKVGGVWMATQEQLEQIKKVAADNERSRLLRTPKEGVYHANESRVAPAIDRSTDVVARNKGSVVVAPNQAMPSFPQENTLLNPTPMPAEQYQAYVESLRVAAGMSAKATPGPSTAPTTVPATEMP